MDSYTKVDLRTVSFDVPPQEVSMDPRAATCNDHITAAQMKDMGVSE